MARRILHVVSALAGGGAEIFVKDLSLALCQAGHTLAVAYVSSAKDQGNDAAIESQFKTDMAAGHVEFFEIGHKARRNPVFGAWRLNRIVRQFRPDVVHVHLGLGLLYRSLSFTGVPTIYTHHNIIFKFGRLLTWWFDRSLVGYIAICKSCETLLRARTQRPVTLIRNGISNRRVAPANPARGTEPFKIISVGRISPQKNFQAVIDIASLCKQQLGAAEKPLRFQVCGDGAEIDNMRLAARAAKVDDMVEFLGGRTDVPELMAAADMLLMTSRYEGMPITLIEAAHAGLPMVATDVGGCSEIVHHGENGFLFAVNNVNAGAAHVMTLYRDASLQRQFGAQSLNIAKDFSMAEVSVLHQRLYETVVSHRQ